MNDLSKEIIGRYELKYVISPQSRAKVLDAALPCLLPDPHGENAVYRVSSLYFDTPDYQFYWDKMDGESRRKKYRLRYYSIDCPENSSRYEVGAAYMEIKHRVDNTLFKQRVRLSAEGALTILEDPRCLSDLHKYVDENYHVDKACILEVENAALKLSLEAKVIVTYIREAWLSEVDQRFRLTLDSSGQAYLPESYYRVASNSGKPFMEPNQLIMEVKFDRAIPYWMRDILVASGLRLQRFSKYAASVDACS